MRMLLCLMTLFSCTAEENLFFKNDDSSVSFEWESFEKNDTLFLVCNQKLVFSDGNDRQTLYPKACAKLYLKQDTVLFATGYSPVPKYVDSSSQEGYSGVMPRRYVFQKELTLSDGQVLFAELSSEIYSSSSSGVEQLLPYVSVYGVSFDKAVAENVTQGYKTTVSFNVLWKLSNESERRSKTVELSYYKKQVDEVDKLLTTTYDSGINWVGDNTFELFVKKNEIWRIQGEKTEVFSSPALDFSLEKSEDKKLGVSKVNFENTLFSSQQAKEDISQQGWTLKKGKALQTVMFSNGAEYFEDVFSYPLWEVSFELEGKKFEFDLNVTFSETNVLSYIDESTFLNATTGKVLFAGRTFERKIQTTLEVERVLPDDGTLKGKIKGFYVTAVFDPAEITQKGEICKKCVLVCYENGYEWGVCAFGQDFPETFGFTKSGFSGFNSVAKRSEEASFEPARVVENREKILWYDAENHLISGIDALTAMIYGWKNTSNGVYTSFISGYQAEVSEDGLFMTLKAPSGLFKTFTSADE